MSLKIESIIFDGESFSAVFLTDGGKVTYTVPRDAIQSAGGEAMLDRAKSALVSKLENAPTKPPKGGHHIHLTAADLSCAQDRR
jgi:hypothetical protein